MLAIDTNVLVRYLTGDHPKQSRAARKLVDANDVFVGDTVMLECEWVLRSVYSYDTSRICRALRAFAGLARVSVESPAALSRALDQAEGGLDLADALHLARADHCDAFITFDRKLTSAAKRAGIGAVRTP